MRWEKEKERWKKGGGRERKKEKEQKKKEQKRKKSYFAFWLENNIIYSEIIQSPLLAFLKANPNLL